MEETGKAESQDLGANTEGPVLRAVFSCMVNWYLNHAARGLQDRGALAGFWSGTNNRSGQIDPALFRRIWPYRLSKKIFQYGPLQRFEEVSRWRCLPFYDAWVRRQQLPEDCNVVVAPMGSCTPLFDLAEATGRRILKVFDAPNSHPVWLQDYWQGECDKFYPGHRIPIPDATFRRIAGEVERADLVLCPSVFVKDSMVANGVPEERCFINHFGVNTSVFQPREEVPEKPVFVSVGNVCLRKGHQYLFRAFAKLKETRPEARLVCIGSTRADFEKEWPRWRDLVEYHPFLPHPEIAKLLQSSTAFVLASVEEGFARVLSEAMAAALPMITTYETGATTVVRDGEEGLIIPSRDIEALHDAMKRLADDRDLNRQMGEKARIAGAVRNTWDDYAGRLHERLGQELRKEMSPERAGSAAG